MSTTATQKARAERREQQRRYLELALSLSGEQPPTTSEPRQVDSDTEDHIRSVIAERLSWPEPAATLDHHAYKRSTGRATEILRTHQGATEYELGVINRMLYETLEAPSAGTTHTDQVRWLVHLCTLADHFADDIP